MTGKLIGNHVYSKSVVVFKRDCGARIERERSVSFNTEIEWRAKG
jgi:hypothetical protein